MSGPRRSSGHELFVPLTILDLVPSTDHHPFRKSIGQPRAVLGSGEKQFFGLPCKGVPAKNLNIETERRAVNFRVTWAWSEIVNLYSRLIMALPRKTETCAI